MSNNDDGNSHQEVAASDLETNNPQQPNASWWRTKSNSHWLGLIVSLVASYLGYIILGLLIKLYFVKGGSRRWLSSWLQTAGWPIPALSAAFLYWKNGLKFNPSPKLMLSYTLLGCLNSVDGFLLAWGISHIPASTAGILSSSQLAFNAAFAYLLTRQKLTSFSWNAVILVVSSAIILSLDSSNDKLQAGVTKAQMVLGYIMTIAASALLGLINPLTELVFDKLLKTRSNQVLVVLEFQACVSMVATIVSSVAMVINHDFQALHEEARVFKSGKKAYYMILSWTALSAQMLFIGVFGTILLGSSLLAGIVSTSLIPVGSILAAVFFHESFGGLKAMAVIISAWGSTSYFYGGYLDLQRSARRQSSS